MNVWVGVRELSMIKLLCICKTEVLEEVKQAKQTFQSQPGMTLKSIQIKSVPKIIQKERRYYSQFV